MEVFHTVALLTARLKSLRYGTLGFVPTMGALHEGHLSLVRICKQQNDIALASIFVNPTQFNDKEDLKKYPRMPEKDVSMLTGAGCDIVFMPDVKEIYPEPDNRTFDFGGLDMVMEGKFRPGHFNGVVQVVTRLFDIIKPDRAYFGLKDYQQLTIIKKIASGLGYPVEIVPCPIIRECDGLAMSSRNMRLSGAERKTALVLSQSLFRAKMMMRAGHTPAEVRKYVTDHVKATSGIELEYFEIVDGESLLPVETWESGKGVIGCLAARVGKIRLIDNMNFSS